MKKLSLFGLYFFLFQLNICAQDTATLYARPFTLTFSEFNHASRIYRGTFTYLITNNGIKVLNTPFGETKSNLLFSKTTSRFSDTLIKLSSLNFDSVKTEYFNNCVLITSGTEYFLSFKNDFNVGEIHLHSYYLKKIEEIVALINQLLPDDYKIKYRSKNSKQDCGE